MMQEPIRVLLIEDNPADARLIELMLAEAKAFSCRFNWVDNLTEGIAQIRSGGVDVVLLDLGLPESTGLDTLERLRAGTRVPTLVVLSGLTDEGVAVQALRSGAQDYLVKGQVDSALLIRAIRYAIGRSDAEEALRQAHDKLETRVIERTAELATAVDALHAEVNERKRAEEDLQRQTSILRSVLDSMADGVVVADARGRLILANPMAEKIFGAGLARDDTRSLAERCELYLPDRTTRYSAADWPLARAIRGESCDNVELFVRDPAPPDGRWLSAAARPLTDQDGVARGGVAVFADITVRKQAEAALRLREQEFRALVEHAPDLVERYDRECRRTYANPALARELGAAPKSLLGHRPTELAEMPAEQALHYEQQIREVLATGHDASVDVVLRHASIQFRLVAERDVNGHVVSVLAIGRDVSEMMDTQRQLTTLLENLPDMVVRFDRRGRCLYVNPAVARVFGMPAHAFPGKTLRALGLDRQGLVEGALQRVVDEVAPALVELPWTGPDGERFFEVRHVPEMDDGGRVTSVLGIAREVTERKRAEQLVRDFTLRREAAREEERKYIARELHDELGQILSALRLEVAALRMRFGQDNPGIAERAASMLVLVDSVIRVQRDLVASLRPAVLDMGIGPALEWLVSEFVERSGIRCELQMSETQLNLDPDQTTMVFRIVQESLTNVARHAQAHRVEVVLTQQPDGYSLTVRDDGKGFDPAAERNPKSLGLIGLQERVQMLGGRVSIRSGDNAGVFIAVTFPAAGGSDRA